MATQVTPQRALPLVAPAARQPRPWRTRLHRLDRTASPYAYVAPFYLIFIAFGLFPLVYTAWVSLHDWSLLADEHPFVGLANYRELLADAYFWNALGNTGSIWVLSTVPQLLLALLLAHLLNTRLRGQTFFRLGLLLPNITSVVAVAVIFSQLFGRDFGLINWVLGSLGAGTIDWQAGTASSHIAISVMVIWRWTGYNALIYLAAMQSIPGELYEAAEIDGASRWRQFLHVTIPSLRPTILFTVVVSTIGAVQLFGEPLLFAGNGTTSGGSSGQYQTLGLLMYQQGWSNFHIGQAATTAWAMFLIILVIVGVNAVIGRLRARADR